MIFTLHQWFELAASVGLGLVVIKFVEFLACSGIRRQTERYLQVDKRLEDIRKTPD